jgi:hypothetical protein
MITECNHDADLKICFACQEKNSVKRLTAERDAAIREIGPAHREAERLRAEVERLTIALEMHDRIENQTNAENERLTKERDDLEQRSLHAVASVIDERDALGHHLGDLLAVIHRDGGQYRAEHGDEKATEDAIVRVQQERLTFRDLLAVADACIQTPGQAWEYNATLEAARELRTALTGREAG